MAATIIDYSPSALEIDAIADAVGTIDPNVPKPDTRYASANADPNTDPAYGDNFLNNSPDVLFVSEYASQYAGSQGALVVFEKYYNATHYEVFRRDYIAQDDSWQRILLIDSNHLEAETLNFSPYIETTLKISIPNGYYAILDADSRVDRISEYKVKATFYPSSATVDYGRALRSKGYLSAIDTTQTKGTIFDVAQQSLGDPDYAWMVALLNDNLPFFGRMPGNVQVSTVAPVVYVPKNTSIIPQMIQESIYFFGLTKTLSNMLNYTGQLRYDKNFFSNVLASVNESKKSLSYTTLNTFLKRDYPNYKGASSSGFVVPDYNDSTQFNTVFSLHTMFLRLNTFYLSAFYTDKKLTVATIKDPGATQVSTVLKPVLAPPGLILGLGLPNNGADI